jgi:hypothetical protein
MQNLCQLGMQDAELPARDRRHILDPTLSARALRRVQRGESGNEYSPSDRFVDRLFRFRATSIPLTAGIEIFITITSV